jgi:hypothetical protein
MLRVQGLTLVWKEREREREKKKHVRCSAKNIGTSVIKQENFYVDFALRVPF